MTAQQNPPVVISAEALEEGPDAVVESNIDVVNAMLGELLAEDEISQNALRSYYVDFFLTQVLVGGFTEYAFASGWNTEVNARVAEGLEAMGAAEHLALFRAAVEEFEKLSPEAREAILEPEFDDEGFEDDEDFAASALPAEGSAGAGGIDEDANEESEAADDAVDEEAFEDEDADLAEEDFVEDAFDDLDEEFYALNDKHDLLELNGKWLAGLPELKVMPEDEIDGYIDAVAGALTDIEERRQAALEEFGEDDDEDAVAEAK